MRTTTGGSRRTDRSFAGRRWLPRLMVLALLAAGAVGLAAGPAAASCVASPPASPHAFRGTVIATSHDDRRATVKADDGREVIVEGGEQLVDGAISSVDRTYQVGGYYEFHPINDSSPYQDNLCTRTELLTPAPGAAPDEPASGLAALGSLAEGGGVVPDGAEPAVDLDVRPIMADTTDDDGVSWVLIFAAVAGGVVVITGVTGLVVFIRRAGR